MNDQAQNFKSVQSLFITGLGDAFILENPKLCDNFDHLANQTILVDGSAYRVITIHELPKKPWYKAGFKFTAVVKKL